MKIVIVGGSAPSTPNVFRSLAKRGLQVPIEFVLTGRSAQSISPVLRACKAAAGDLPYLISSALQDDKGIFSNADLIVVQARFGGLEGREFDETFSLDADICGDEGLGPGGLSAAWRGWPQLSRLLGRIVDEAPHAKIVVLSAPLGIYCRCAKAEFPQLNVVGLCELPWTTLQSLANDLACSADDLAYDYLATNHIGWFSNIRLNAKDAWPQILDARHAKNSSAFPSLELLRKIESYPLKYLELVYERENVVKRQKSSISRSRQLMDLARKAKSVFDAGTSAEMDAILAERATPWYEHAVAPFICKFAGIDVGKTCFFLTTENRGYTQALPDDAVIEIPHRFASQGRLEQTCRNASSSEAKIAKDVRAYVDFEAHAADVVASRDASALSSALLRHPWLRDDADIAETLARRMFDYSTR